MNSTIAHIVYASDEKFAELLGVSLVSLYENSQDMDDIVVYILDGGISEENRKKVDSISLKYNRSLPRWIVAINIVEELSINVDVDRGGLIQYARLFISSSLPKEVDRVLYLDCDIIVNQSIKELWNLDMHGKTIAALMDAFSKYYRKNIDLKPNDIMFNSGVMLIDMSQWKKKHIEEQLKKFIRKKSGRIQQGDQGALNAVLSYEVYCFEPRFNSVSIFYDFTYNEMMIYRKPPTYYTENELKKAIESPVIIHFTTSFLSRRVWMKGCHHRYVNKWQEYKNMSPWKDAELWEDNRSTWKKRVVQLYEMLPRRVGIRLASLLQVYVRPLKNYIRS